MSDSVPARQPDGSYPSRVPTLQGAVIDLLKGECKHVLPARFVDGRQLKFAYRQHSLSDEPVAIEKIERQAIARERKEFTRRFGVVAAAL
ncbi:MULTISPECIES: hypothetical protein [Sinorhizobium]|uniref:hypothetical protein n=1 Tax=Sinorhizobium TaxID=28105 RepID=UPI000AA0FE99|nr:MULTISPECIES: hypothetical protein [Sinorhizobium]WOS67026.1 hypothetical protein SFGR64A_32050 [Sinorhizobium fredii GR64]